MRRRGRSTRRVFFPRAAHAGEPGRGRDHLPSRAGLLHRPGGPGASAAAGQLGRMVTASDRVDLGSFGDIERPHRGDARVPHRRAGGAGHAPSCAGGGGSTSSTARLVEHGDDAPPHPPRRRGRLRDRPATRRRTGPRQSLSRADGHRRGLRGAPDAAARAHRPPSWWTTWAGSALERHRPAALHRRVRAGEANPLLRPPDEAAGGPAGRGARALPSAARAVPRRRAAGPRGDRGHPGPRDRGAPHQRAPQHHLPLHARAPPRDHAPAPRGVPVRAPVGQLRVLRGRDGGDATERGHPEPSGGGLPGGGVEPGRALPPGPAARRALVGECLHRRAGLGRLRPVAPRRGRERRARLGLALPRRGAHALVPLRDQLEPGRSGAPRGQRASPGHRRAGRALVAAPLASESGGAGVRRSGGGAGPDLAIRAPRLRGGGAKATASVPAFYQRALRLLARRGLRPGRRDRTAVRGARRRHRPERAEPFARLTRHYERARFGATALSETVAGRDARARHPRRRAQPGRAGEIPLHAELLPGAQRPPAAEHRRGRTHRSRRPGAPRGRVGRSRRARWRRAPRDAC